MAKLPLLTRGIKGPPIRRGPISSPPYVPTNSANGCIRYIVKYTPNRQPIFYDDGEKAFPVVLTIVDEDYYQDLRPQTQAYRVSQVFTDNDESAPLGGFRLDEDYWTNPPQQTLPSSRLVWADNDEGAPLGGFRLEEDDYQHSQLMKLVPNIQPLSFDSEDIVLTSVTIVDEDYWDRPIQPILPSSRLVFTDNDDAAPLGGFRIDEEYWIFPGLQPILRNQQPITDTDELFLIAAPFGLEEDEWLWSLWRPQFIPPIPQAPTTDQDEREGIPLPPTDTDVWHGRRRKAWPLPPPAFPLEKEEPPQIMKFGETAKTEFVPEWIKTIVKKPLTEGRGIYYPSSTPLEVEIVAPKVVKPKKAKATPGISTEELNTMQRRQEEEEAIISLLMRDEL